MKKLLTKSAFAALTIAALLSVAVPGSAHAAPRRDDWHGHEVHAHDWNRHHPHYEQGVVYAPPAVVEPPPSPGINLIVPLHFR